MTLEQYIKQIETPGRYASQDEITNYIAAKQVKALEDIRRALYEIAAAVNDLNQ